MKIKYLLSVMAVLVALSLTAACTGTPDNGTAPATPTPTQTTQGTATTVQTVVPLTPQPTEMPPSNLGEVDIQAQKDPVSNEISVIFRGGKGQSWTRDLNVTVVRSDGTIVNNYDMEPRIGSEVDIPGTRGDDRVIVIATMSTGNSYRVYDTILRGR